MAPHGESCPTRILRALALPARLSNPGATDAEVAGDPTVAPPPVDGMEHLRSEAV